MKNVAKRVAFIFGFGLLGLCVCFLVSCAGQRQGVVCDEIEYRYNSMAYSPDQRVFMEEELRACREEEAKKKQASAETHRSIYERFASQDTTGKVHTAADSAATVVPRDSSAAIPSDSSATPEPVAPSDSTVAVDSTAATEGSAVTDSTTVEAPQE